MDGVLKVSWIEKYACQIIFNETRKELTGKYYVRGGISLPKTDIKRARIIPGVIIIIAESCDNSQKNYVLDEQEFLTIKDLPIFFQRVIDKWQIDCYYCGEPKEILRRYRRQINDFYKEMSIKPYFIPIDISTGRESLQIIWEYMNEGRLFFPKKGPIYKELQIFVSNSQEKIPPSLLALVSVLRGNILYPYRKRDFK